MILVYPGPGPTPAVVMIQKAQRQIRLNTYELTSHAIERALVAAKARGVRVRVLLDRSPYRARRILAREVSWCHQYRIDCKLSPRRFRYDHAKYLISDGVAWIGTMNFTYSGFHHNREAAFVTNSPAAVKAADAVFTADWRGARAGPAPRHTLVLSPGAVPDLLKLVKGASGPVYIESEELGHLGALSRALKALGGRLRMILPSSVSRYDRKNACRLEAAGAHVRTLSHPYPHIKLIITRSEVFIGSENLSYTSLYKNREMGLMLSQKAAGGLDKAFYQDWQRGAAIDCGDGGRRGS